MCGFRAVLIFIETAMTPVRTAIASTGGMIASVAGKRTVFRTIRSAFTTVDALSIVVTLQEHFAFVGQDPVFLDFFADGRFFLSDGLGDCGFGGTVGNAGKNDPPFF